MIVGAAAVLTVAPSVPAWAVTGSWTIMPAQPSANAFELNGVASVGSRGLAVGTILNAGEHGIVMRYDGANWGFVTVPQTNPDVVLTGATMASTSDGWAVGTGSDFGGFYSGTRPVALHWNGSTLTSAAPSLTTRSKFTAVSALAANDVYAVGRIGANSLVEHWNGSSWSQVAVPDPNPSNPAAVDSLKAVSARTTSDVWAVGSYSGGPFSLHFDGTSWKVFGFPTPSGSTETDINGVVAVASGDAWAVGASFDASGKESTVTEHWTGTGWHLVSSLTGTASASLTGVAARASGDVWAVGWATTPTDATVRTVSLHWDGSAWTRLPSPPAGGGTLTSVSTRPGASQVLAAGSDNNDFGFVMSHP
jgi:hypothetical protein